jgi:hypothetical protein
VSGGTHDGCKASKGWPEHDVRFAGSRGVQLLMLKTEMSAAAFAPASTRIDLVNNYCASLLTAFFNSNHLFPWPCGAA